MTREEINNIDHTQATKILRKMYRKLDTIECRFIISRKIIFEGKLVDGIYEYDDDGSCPSLITTIRLDPNCNWKGGLITILLHELCHHLFNDLSCPKCDLLAKKLYHNLSDKQLTNLMRRCF